VGISVSLPAEVLAALDKMRGSKDRSPYLAELIAQEAIRNKVAIRMPKITTALDIVAQATATT
jgi:metal-responsive CopG/Arc/MetJ family transcriptional regulator